MEEKEENKTKVTEVVEFGSEAVNSSPACDNEIIGPIDNLYID